MGELGSVGEYITEQRREKLEEERREKAVTALEAAYTKLAEKRYGDAVVRALLSWLHFGGGGSPSGLVHHDKVPEKMRDGFYTLKEWHRQALKAAGQRYGDVTVALLKEASARTQGHLGEWILDECVYSWERQTTEALAALEWYGKARGWIEEPGEETYVIGEDFEESPLHEMYQKRREQGRSLQAIVVARDNDTGTGKTTLAVSLCKKWGDDWGAENATNRPNEYRDFLNNKPEGSVLLADEIGQMFDSRRSMSSENVEVSQDWQMIRTKRYITLSTLPGPSFLDKRLKKLADVMILCTRRGHARVYRLKVDDQDGGIWREHLCNVEWGPLDDDPDYQAVEEMKRERLKERFEGKDGTELEYDEDEIADPEEARRDGRNETIKQLVEGGMTQTEVAEALDMDQSTVSRICRERSD